MIYKILAMADVHWGALDPDKQRNELRFIFEYLDTHKIDLLTICGDYFDHRLMLNSKTCVYALEMLAKLKEYAEIHDFKIVMFLGTKSHDCDQLDALDHLEDNNFKLYKETTYDETLSGLHCLYSPDEAMSFDDYTETYRSILFSDYTGKNKPIDIMFFHGSFDVILKGVEPINAQNIVFDYSFLNTKCVVMVGGHWHDASEYGNVIYTRSPNRFKYDEDNPKGVVLLSYNTEDQSYIYERIENPYTDKYITYTVDTGLFKSLNDYTLMCNDVDDVVTSDPKTHVRIHIYITDEKDINKSCIESVSYRFANNKMVKVVTENKLTKKRKEEKRKRNIDMHNKYAYLFDTSATLCEKYQKFIKDTTGKDIEIEQLKLLLSKFI